jgi:uncharacterized protein with FMN-binding domain
MRRAILAIISTVTGLVMLLSFKTHGEVTSISAAAAPPAAVSGTTGTTGTGGSGSSPSESSTSGGTSGANATKTVTGDSVDTRWGPVQVQITVAGGKITAAQAVVYPQENPRDQQINAYAIPTLNDEALQAGNASIDTVSGATYTSIGYIGSLQSALDKANG